MSTDAAETIQRQTQAVILRNAGLSYRVIADRLGYAGPSGAWTAVMAALRESQREAVDEMRLVENSRLDTYTAALAPAVQRGEVKAVLAAVRVSHRRSALNGLDAPRQIAVTLPLRDDLGSAIASLEQSLAEVYPDEFGGDQPETPE